MPVDPINLYGLVSYLPDPLGPFLDQLRCDLVPSCFAQSHLSVLPPRSIACSEDLVEEQLRAGLGDISPFEVELKDVEIFEKTFVIYLGVGRGSGELKQIHERLNLKCLASEEVHAFHPHITLAQDFDVQDVERLAALAKERWAQFQGRKAFAVERLTWVQKTTTQHWVDLTEYPLASASGVLPAVNRTF